MRAIGMLLFWLGGALLVAVLAVGVLVAFANFRGLGETADRAVRIDGSAQVHAEAGDTLLYYFSEDGAERPGAAGASPGTAGASGTPGTAGADSGTAGADSGTAGTGSGTAGTGSGAADHSGSRCEVEGPDPQSLRTHMSSSFTFEGGQYRSQGGFHAGASGTYTVTCTSAAGAPVPNALVAPPVDAQGIVFGVFGVLGGVFGGLLFGSMCVVGLVLWIVGRSRLNRTPPG
jgi:hypothetical protein